MKALTIDSLRQILSPLNPACQYFGSLHGQQKHQRAKYSYGALGIIKNQMSLFA
jgi:hypothetical protein